tara:strand:+ start:205 stop:495 length:291 start_codon:yes stop_codon:yes gene_type:complete
MSNWKFFKSIVLEVGTELKAARRGIIAKKVISTFLTKYDKLPIEQKSTFLSNISRVGWALNQLRTEGYCYNSKGGKVSCGNEGKLGKQYQGQWVFI